MSKTVKSYLKTKLESLNSDQKILFSDMQKDNKLQICIPTGAGKGYLMMVDLLNQVVKSKNQIFVISTHRLMLNDQHLTDIFNMMQPLVGKIGYIFVGSNRFDQNKFQDNPSFNRALLEKKLSYNDIISSTTNKEEVNRLVKEHLDKKRKVVILTTYHSLITLGGLPIDTIYNDEAHTLATEQDSSLFKANFKTIGSERCFFFTATPKDCNDEDTESFLMNNEDIFGKRVGLNFRECVEKAYIVRPIVHTAVPANFSTDVEFKSIENMCIFIKDAFAAHRKYLKEDSIDANKIAPKILVKCSSVDDMWSIHKELVGKLNGVRICAGASRGMENGSSVHYVDNLGISNRGEYLDKLQSLKDEEEAIVLHYDVLSEGINVAGFTGVMFLGGKLPTISKILQNVGRSTRLHKIDRDLIVKSEIKVGDGKWIKPNCYVILPYWDSSSMMTKEELSKKIKELRDNFKFDAVYKVSIGDDTAKGEEESKLKGENKPDERKIKFQLIDEIRNEIERLDKEEMDLKEMERVNSLSKLDLLKEKLNF